MMKTLKKSSGKSQQPTLKHVPQRTCIACREVRPKRDLVRLVYGSDGLVQVDASGRKPGRGAYICRSPECWQKGVSKGKLEHALKSSIGSENRAGLIKFGTAIRGGEAAPSQTGVIS